MPAATPTYIVRAVRCDHTADDETVYQALRRATAPLDVAWARLGRAKTIAIKFNQDKASQRVVLFKNQRFTFPQGFGSYVMEHVLFKISFPAEFHAQTAVECAMALHNQVKDRLDQIDKIVIRTHESAIRIIDKKGPLNNPADRDHCIQYMVAIPMIHGRLTAADYEDDIARDPRVDALRDKMECVEEKQFTKDYLDPEKRSIANAIQVFFKDGSKTGEVVVEYPIGHRRRRAEGIPVLEAKFKTNLARRFALKQSRAILDLCQDQKKLEATPVNEFVDLFVV